MDLVSKARLEIGKNIRFDMRSDGVNSTNCIQFVLHVAGYDPRQFKYPIIDDMIKKFKQLDQPKPGAIIAFPSSKIGRGSWEKFVPGCAAIISEVKDNKVSKIIIAHPKVPGIIGEITPELFDGKPNSFLEVS